MEREKTKAGLAAKKRGEKGVIFGQQREEERRKRNRKMYKPEKKLAKNNSCNTELTRTKQAEKTTQDSNCTECQKPNSALAIPLAKISRVPESNFGTTLPLNNSSIFSTNLSLTPSMTSSNFIR
ncbi:hypothetical protein V6Z11_D12G102800 [Gossypium hirsutum]